MNLSSIQMKKKILFLGLLVSTISLSSCNKETNSSENSKISGESEQIKIKDAWNASDDWVKQITLSDTLIFRRKSWGMDLNTIQENIELAEGQPDKGKSYSMYFDKSDLNFVDITYVPNSSGLLAEIILDVYVEETSKAIELQNNIRNYFDVKFGASVSNGKKITWSQHKNTQVLMENVSSSKDPGIKISLKAKP